MAQVTKLKYKYPSRVKLADLVTDSARTIPEPTLSILKLISSHKYNKKDNEHIKFLATYTNENGNDADGFYKYDLYIVMLDNKQYQAKIDIDGSGGTEVNIVITSITFDRVL
jgi:hypothetical protein